MEITEITNSYQIAAKISRNSKSRTVEMYSIL